MEKVYMGLYTESLHWITRKNFEDSFLNESNFKHWGGWKILKVFRSKNKVTYNTKKKKIIRMTSDFASAVVASEGKMWFFLEHKNIIKLLICLSTNT